MWGNSRHCQVLKSACFWCISITASLVVVFNRLELPLSWLVTSIHRVMHHAWVTIIVIVMLQRLDLCSQGAVSCPMVRASIAASRHSVAEVAASPVVRTAIAASWHSMADTAAMGKTRWHMPVRATAVEISASAVWSMPTRLHHMRRA